MEAEKLFLRLNNDYKKVFITEKRVGKIRSSTQAFVANRDLELLYDGMFLKSVTIFESFIEELFIGLLYKGYTLNTPKKVQKHIFPNRKLVINYIKHKNSYLELMPYTKLKDATKIFYQKDNPFAHINDGAKSALSEIYTIRNAIAHNSKFSMSKYKKLLHNKGVTDPKKLNSPARFLKSLHSPEISTFENYILELNSAARDIINFN